MRQCLKFSPTKYKLIPTFFNTLKLQFILVQDEHYIWHTIYLCLYCGMKRVLRYCDTRLLCPRSHRI